MPTQSCFFLPTPTKFSDQRELRHLVCLGHLRLEGRAAGLFFLDEFAEGTAIRTDNGNFRIASWMGSIGH